MKPQRTMIRPMLAGLAVVGLSLGATAREGDSADGASAISHAANCATRLRKVGGGCFIDQCEDDV